MFNNKRATASNAAAAPQPHVAEICRWNGRVNYANEPPEAAPLGE